MKHELTLQNPWWDNKEKISADDKVRAAESVKSAIKYEFTNKNLVLLGPRQVGKTTYLKLFIKQLIEQNKEERNIVYFSCEPLDTKKDLIQLFREINELSLDEGKKYILLDEVTSVKNWEHAIKYLLEQKPIPNFQLICTGSNAHLLKEGSERFPGRNIKTQLFLPLTFSEYIKNLTNIKFSSFSDFSAPKIFQNCKRLFPLLDLVNKELKNYLKTGGIPKAIYEYKANRTISSETYEVYARWILGGLSKLNKKKTIFRPLVKGIIMNYTSQVSLNAMAKDFQIPTHTTVETYLELLNQLLLINILYCVDQKTRTAQFRKNKKIYFQDPFFYNVFKGFTYGTYMDYSETTENAIIEGVVCQELASVSRQSPDVSNMLWYYSSKKETDFAVKQGHALTGIEVKWSSSAKAVEFNNRFVFKERILLSKDALSYDKEKNIYVLPLSLFLLSLRSNSEVYSK